MQLIGYQKKTFTFQDGGTCSGCHLFVTDTQNGVTGYSCDRVFVKDSVMSDIPPLGSQIHFNYNRYGKVIEVVVDEKA